MTEAIALRCAACSATRAEDDRFCEQCGARLTNEPQADAADRVELDLATAAAISDRGRIHRRNEDAFRVDVSSTRRVAAVVCDGISGASSGDIAARGAADAAGNRLREALADAEVDPAAAVLQAIAGAQRAVARVPWTTRTDRGLPSCTLVCALCRGREIVIGSVGDSRAYWIDAGTTQQLSVDDSWAAEQVADGRLTFEQALRDPRSHSITDWIGADAPERVPELTPFWPDRSGRLLLCTDGLWNYLSSGDELGELINALPTGASAAAIARALVDTALFRGGRDNITAAVIDIP